MERSDVARALRILTAAFPSQPFDEASTAVYTEQLAERVHDPAVLYAVVTDWISDRLMFPKVAELLEGCAAEAAKRSNRQRAIRAGQKSAAAAAEGGVACQPCSDTGWEIHDEEHDGRIYVAAIPCRLCEPVRHADWRDGHLDPDHVTALCDSMACQRRASGGKRRSGGIRPKDDSPRDRRADSKYTGPGF